MMESKSINYHFMIDDKFIDGFIADSETTNSINKYILTDEGPLKFVKSELIELAPYYSGKLSDILSKINNNDRVFIHWYSPKVNEIILKIPSKTKVYLLFWGADFLESPSFSHSRNALNRFLFDPITLKSVQKESNSQLFNFIKFQNTKAKKSRNIKNIIATYWSNINLITNYITRRNYKRGIIERRVFLNRLEAVCHWNHYDIEILENLYNVNLKQKYFIYDVGVNDLEIVNQSKIEKALTIWLGNSDTPTNNHKDILKKLTKFKNEEIKIICPLNYGNKHYSDEIATYGNYLFGEKFIPLQHFLDRETYYHLMNEVDVAIMAHNRGQAGGNIIAFLKKGIRVYMKPQSSIFKYFKSLGIEISSISELLDCTFDDLKIKTTDLQRNRMVELLNQSITNENKRIEALNKILLDE